MTPFEYDVNPYNGWLTLDGNPATNESTDGVDNNGDSTPDDPDEGDRRIIWGCEYPDLLLTENIAFHDRRVADTDDDDGERDKRQKNGSSTTMEGDDDLDQVRIPQGSLFFELYATGNRQANGVTHPRELYDANGDLDLGRVAPESTDGLRYPVWQIAISVRPADINDSPLQRATQKPDSTSFDPLDMTLLRSSTPGAISPEPLAIERVVWFTPLDPGNPAAVARARNTYYSRLGAVDLSGPANEPATSNVRLSPGGYAVLGPRADTRIGSKVRTDPAVYEASPHRIQMGPAFSALENDGTNGYPVTGTTIRQPLGIVTAAKAPTTWTDAGLIARGIGLSISEPLPQNPAYYQEPTFVHYGALPDAYDEVDPNNRTNLIPDTPFDTAAATPLGSAPASLRTGTYRNFKSAFLQRLANPLEPYDPVSNPYITIDWSTVDLTVFNGEDREPAGWMLAGESWDPDDPNPDGNPNEHFATRERGSRGFNDAAPPAPPTPTSGVDRRLWPQDASTPMQTPNKSGPTDNFFRYNLVHTLGYLNKTFGGLPGTEGPLTSPPDYIGDPLQPFPWLTWFNRPFDSPFELMLVPHSAPSRLCHEFTTIRNEDPYDPSGGVLSARAPFDHLLNFFHTSTNANQSSHFYRLFDYVETPSPFVGTRTWYNPGGSPHFGGAAAGSFADEFRPPFNQFSRFRDPGRININTIFDSFVWNGLMKGHTLDAGGNPSWDDLKRSRQGFPGSAINPTFPTQFANSFRTASSSHLAPLNIPEMRVSGVEATLLRKHPSDAAAPGNPQRPLFKFISGSEHNHSNRNAHFRYRGLTRMPNLVTTHSNTFAIWITVGYFELDSQLRFGNEAGSLTGDIQRNRMFAVVDRSIPVAYEQPQTGQPVSNQNVDRMILIKRLLE